MGQRLRVGIDTGGTFTDIVALEPSSRQFLIHKVPSTPDDPGRALVQGVTEVVQRLGGAEVDSLVHGTTVATNAVLQRSGANVAFVTTRGFRDVLHIQRQSRPKLYDMRARRTEPLVSRFLRFEVDERTLYDGSIECSPNPNDLANIIQQIQREQVQAVAVGLLNSYVNARNEISVGAVLRQALKGIPVCLSHELSQEQGEYERFSTCVMNAYVQPIMQRYLGQLDAALRRENIQAPLWVMKSNGGMALAARVAHECVQTILSGPAGGVICGSKIARHHSNPNLITADMGGTSFDVSVLDEGRISFARDTQIDGLAIQTPMLDLHTVGAGGGSIGWVDAGGALRVGPRSAGSVPGPACYQRGGQEPTVTDANLVLGRMASNSRLGNGLKLDVESARRAIFDRLANRLGITVERAAEGMIRIVNATMVAAIRKLTVERGLDPRKFVLCPFGGAGPLHGAELAEEMGVAETLVPSSPGVTSALGLLMSNVREDRVRTQIERVDRIDISELERQFRELENQACSHLRQSGFETVCVVRQIGMRYRGQGFDIPIAVPNTEIDLAHAVRSFHVAHKRKYGYDSPHQFVETAHLWVSAEAEVGAVGLPPPLPTCRSSFTHSERPVMFAGTWVTTPILERDQLRPGERLQGPAVIEQVDSTTVVWPRQPVLVDSFGQLLLGKIERV